MRPISCKHCRIDLHFIANLVIVNFAELLQLSWTIHLIVCICSFPQEDRSLGRLVGSSTKVFWVDCSAGIKISFECWFAVSSWYDTLLIKFSQKGQFRTIIFIGLFKDNYWIVVNLPYFICRVFIKHHRLRWSEIHALIHASILDTHTWVKQIDFDICHRALNAFNIFVNLYFLFA